MREDGIYRPIKTVSGSRLLFMVQLHLGSGLPVNEKIWPFTAFSNLLADAKIFNVQCVTPLVRSRHRWIDKLPFPSN